MFKQVKDKDSRKISNHSGGKYLRAIESATESNQFVDVDIYSVLKAFNVQNPATAHAIKKLLCPGMRGEKTRKQDIQEAIDALYRAQQLEEDCKVTIKQNSVNSVKSDTKDRQDLG